MKLYYHSSSSASLRVLIFLSCRGIPENKVKLIETGIDFDNRGIPVWTIPSNDEQYNKLKTSDYKALNPEDASLTVEGLPAPLRAILVGTR